jgi:hypothetical protein
VSGWVAGNEHTVVVKPEELMQRRSFELAAMKFAWVTQVEVVN